VEKQAHKYKMLGLKVAYYRKLKGFTQEQLAEKLGKSTQHIGALEAPNVLRTVSIGTLFDMSDLLGVPVYKFFQFDEDE